MEGEGQHHGWQTREGAGAELGSTEPLNRVKPKIWTTSEHSVTDTPCECLLSAAPATGTGCANEQNRCVPPTQSHTRWEDGQATQTTTYITGRWQGLSGAHYITFTVKASLNQDITQRNLTLPGLWVQRGPNGLSLCLTLFLCLHPVTKAWGWSPLLSWSSHPTVTLGHWKPRPLSSL